MISPRGRPWPHTRRLPEGSRKASCATPQGPSSGLTLNSWERSEGPVRFRDPVKSSVMAQGYYYSDTKSNNCRSMLKRMKDMTVPLACGIYQTRWLLSLQLTVTPRWMKRE